MRLRAIIMCLAVMLAACGGGSSGGGSSSASPGTATSYSIGGVVVGMGAGASVMLQINGSENLSVLANGTFSFSKTLTTGSAYSASVISQPAGETCTISGGNGSVSVGNVSSIAVTCTSNSVSHFAYVANYGTNDISVYSLNPLTGNLTEIAGSRFAAGSNPVGVVVHPSKNFLYVSNSGTNNISGYTINPITGVPTQISSSPIATASGPNAMVIDPAGHYLYVESEGPVVTLPGGGTTRNSASVSGYSIDSSTGALTQVPGSPYFIGNQSTGITIDPSGRHLYVSSTAGVTGFSIASNNGALTSIPGYVVNDFGAIAASPVGEYIYMNLAFHNKVTAAAIDVTSGQLSALSTSLYSTGAFPETVTFKPAGDYVYIVNSSDNTVSAFAANSTTGSLSAVSGSPFSVGGSPNAMAIDPSGKYAYVVNTNLASISAYSIGANSGSLSVLPVGPFSTGSGPMAIAFK